MCSASAELHTATAAPLLQPPAQLRDFSGIDLPVLDEAHHQLLGRSAEHPVDEVADRVAQRLIFGDDGAVLISAAAQPALQLALAVQDVQHGLHRGVGEGLLQLRLHRIHVAGAQLPDGLHDLQLQAG